MIFLNSCRILLAEYNWRTTRKRIFRSPKIPSYQRLIKKILILFFIVCLVACGTWKVDLPKVSFQPSVNDQSKNRQVKSIKLVNQAKRGENMGRFLGDSHIAVEPEISTKEVIENDIRSYFEKRLVLSDSATKSFKIKIKKANSYYIAGSGDTVPFVGLFTVHSYHPYYLHLDVFFEIEEDGKVIKSYDFDEKIILENGKTAYPSDIQESYIRLIRLYRDVFFNLLDSEFIDRYF